MSRTARAVSPAHLTDDQLGRQALRGDREAFTELFGRHEGGLYNVAYRLTGDREDAADITQEAFLRVFARLDDLAGREVNLPAYLHRTARNLVYDRSAARARETPVEEIAGAAGADEAMEADPQLTALVSAQGADVRAANARLPERHRLVLALRELEDMSYEDIGRVLDVTPGAVAQLLGRARTALRRELRLQHLDPERMDPGCRRRLGAIGALIDGELDPDRAQVLTRHLAECPSCREARAAFEEARVTYRAWLPLPILLGLGADTARAAEARGLVRFDSDGGGPDGGDGGDGRGPFAGGVFGSRRRILVGSLALLLLLGASTVVGVRSGSDDPLPGPPAPPVAAARTTTAASSAATAPGPATAGGTTTAPASASFVAPPPVAGPGAAAAVELPPEATTARARTRAAAPTVTSAGGAVATVAPPVSTQAPATTEVAPVTEPPAAEPTTTRDPGPNDPGTPSDPPPTTTRRDPVPPPPVTTIRVPPVITIAPPR